MSNINAYNITTINATIQNLNVQTINGIPASQYGNCSQNSYDNCCSENDPYDYCPCEEHEHDNTCPGCIPYNTNTNSCKGAQGPQGFQGATGPENTNLYSNYLYPNGQETTTINPTFNKLMYTPPNLPDSISTTGFTAGVPKPLTTPSLLGPTPDSNGIQFATSEGLVRTTFIPNSLWNFSIWLDTNVSFPQTMQVYWELYYNDDDLSYSPQLMATSVSANIINNGGVPLNYVIQNNVSFTSLPSNVSILIRVMCLCSVGGGTETLTAYSIVNSPNFLAITFPGVTGSIGFTGPQGFQGNTGPQGFQGNTGPQGEVGLSSSFFNYKADTTSFTPPVSNGYVEWNNVTQTSATQIFISHIDNNNNDVEILLGSLNAGDILTIQDQANSNNYQRWTITNVSVVVNQYITYGVSLIVSTHLFSNNDPILLITRTIGATGAQGFQGFQGFQGNTGAQGFQGFQGNTGAQGFQGFQGNTGAQGFQGFQGNTGSQGFQGNTGAQGFQGFQGNTGAQGFQGFQGNIGAQGFQGFQGNIGAQGFQGNTGAQGFQGFQGSQGFQGNTGAQGFQGNTGAQGFQGFQGNTGAQGFQGNTGAQGFQGFQGNTGAQGFQGNTGAQGFQGFQGSNTSGTSMIGGYVGNIKRANATYFGIYFASTTDQATTNENDTYSIIPFNSTISNFYIWLSANAGVTGSSYTFNIRKNNVATSVITTISGLTNTGSDLTNSVTFTSGDIFSISSVPSVTPQPTDNLEVRWFARLTSL